MGEGLLDRVPPHSDEAEVSVLGACMLDHEACGLALADLTPTEFYKTAHGKIFEAIVAVRERGGRADLVTVQAEIAQRKKLDSVGGPAYLREIEDAVPSSANVMQYIEIVREKAYRRQVIQACVGILTQVFDGSMSVDELMALDNPLENQFAPWEEQTLSDVLHGVMDYLEVGRRDEYL